jgi:putative ABC transport system ATP-binding protein
MNSTDHVLLHLDDVGKTYQMGEVAVEVLKHIDLQIFHSELLVLVGPSGSGKTTMLNLIGGLDTPTVGHGWYGRHIVAGPRITRRRKPWLCFSIYNLIPNLTRRERDGEIAAHPMNVDEVLDLVGLADRADHFPAQLSGGEQQRVAIARALAKNPELLLCDEPTGALDFETGKKVLRLLVDLKNKLDKTIMVITHNAALAEAADRVVRLRSGQIVEIHDNPQPKPPEEIVW